jgi:hypothetical protein
MKTADEIVRLSASPCRFDDNKEWILGAELAVDRGMRPFFAEL